jgi:hypothetical protein
MTGVHAKHSGNGHLVTSSYSDGTHLQQKGSICLQYLGRNFNCVPICSKTITAARGSSFGRYGDVEELSQQIFSLKSFTTDILQVQRSIENKPSFILSLYNVFIAFMLVFPDSL